MMRLTPHMREALILLTEGPRAMPGRAVTMRALEKRGLVRSKRSKGTTLWAITSRGSGTLGYRSSIIPSVVLRPVTWYSQLTPEGKQRFKRVRIRQVNGDDGNCWAIFIDGVARYHGMARGEAEWRRKRFIETGEL